MSDRINFAVLLCSHNGGRFIEAQLDSLGAQSRAPDYVAIHDWGSTDDTREKIRGWIDGREQAANYHLTLHDDAPGPGTSFLESLGLLQESYPAATHIFFCDQDDRWLPRKLAVYEEHLQRTGQRTQLLFSDLQLMTPTGDLSAESFYARPGSPFQSVVSLDSPDIGLVNPAVGMTCCLARPLAKLLVDNRAAPWPMHDWAAILLCRAYGMESQFIPESLVAYRQHEGNIVGAPAFSGFLSRVRKIKGRLALLAGLRAWCLGFPPSARDNALLLLPRNRWEAVRAISRSSNARSWYRIVLALMIVISWPGERGND